MSGFVHIGPGRSFNDKSLTATATSQVALPKNRARTGWKIKNDSAVDVWIKFVDYETPTAAAVATPGGGNIKIAAGGYLAAEPNGVETGDMSIIAASGTANVTIYEFV